MSHFDREPAPADRAPSLLRSVGLGYFLIAFFARVPFAMMVVGVLTIVATARGSISAAGMSSAAVGVGTACFGALLGAAADRFGQRPVLIVVATANALLMVAFAAVVYSGAPDLAMYAAAFTVGATAPQVAPMSRARLVGVIDRTMRPERRPRIVSSTMAYESAADETVFVLGPFVVGILAAGLAPWAPLVGAAILTMAFVVAFALHPTARRVSNPGHDIQPASPVRELFRARVLVIVIGIFGVGLFFGNTLTSLTSFMADRGAAESAGVMYGVMGIGSAIFALGVSILPARFTPRARWVVFAAVMLSGSALVAAADSITTMVIALGLVGIGIGPTIVTQYSFGAAASPVGRSTTVMTMLGSGVIVGQSFGSALTGQIAETFGTPAALLLPAVAAAVVFGSGIVNARLYRPVLR